MHPAAPTRANLYVMALAVLFSGLLLSLAVLPTLINSASEAAVTAPVPTEEEQLHGRDVHKLSTMPDKSWCCSTILLGQRLNAAFRDRDEALPNGPISDVPLQPPKGC